MIITHKFKSEIPDAGDDEIVSANAWNEDHDIEDLAIADVDGLTAALAAKAATADLGDLAAIDLPGGTTDFLRADGTFAEPPGSTGTGDVVGPASAVNNRVVFFDGTTGKLVKDSGLVLSGMNTGDQTSVSGNAGTATKLATARAIDGVDFDGSAAIAVIAPATFAATAKTTPVDADVLPMSDSAASNVLKKLTWAAIKATLKAYFDTLYAVIGSGGGGGGSSGPSYLGCKAYNDGAQSIPNNSVAALTFAAEEWDTHAVHSTASNTSRFTVPAGMDGRWRFLWHVRFAGSSTGTRILFLKKNGSTNVMGGAVQVAGLGSENHVQGFSTVSLVAGDYIEIFVYQDSGGALDSGSTVAADIAAVNTFEAQFLDNESGVSGGGGGPSQTYIGCKAYSDVTQAVANNVYTALTLNKEAWDTHGLHSTSSNTSRLTVPAGMGGQWRLSWHCYVPPGLNTRYFLIRKNGGTAADNVLGSIVAEQGTTADGNYMANSITAYLADGDFVEVFMLHASGGSINVGFAITTDPSLAFTFEAQYLGDVAPTVGVPVNPKSADYTLVPSDGNATIYHPSTDTTARTWTIPSNAAVAFPVGTVVTFDNDIGAGTISIAITTDTLVLVGPAGSTGTRFLAAGGQATAYKVSTTRWRISGTGLT